MWIGKTFPAACRYVYGILRNTLYSPSIPEPQGKSEYRLLLHNIIAPEERQGVLVDVNTGPVLCRNWNRWCICWGRYLSFPGNYLEKWRVCLLCFVLFDIYVELNGSVTPLEITYLILIIDVKLNRKSCQHEGHIQWLPR